jgi:hypothetical protein
VPNPFADPCGCWLKGDGKLGKVAGADRRGSGWAAADRHPAADRRAARVRHPWGEPVLS